MCIVIINWDTWYIIVKEIVVGSAYFKLNRILKRKLIKMESKCRATQKLIPYLFQQPQALEFRVDLPHLCLKLSPATYNAFPKEGSQTSKYYSY